MDAVSDNATGPKSESAGKASSYAPQGAEHSAMAYLRDSADGTFFGYLLLVKRYFATVIKLSKGRKGGFKLMLFPLLLWIVVGVPISVVISWAGSTDAALRARQIDGASSDAAAYFVSTIRKAVTPVYVTRAITQLNRNSTQLLPAFNSIIAKSALDATEGTCGVIGMAPNGINIVKYPLAGNEKSIGHNLFTKSLQTGTYQGVSFTFPNRREDNLKVVKERDVYLTNPQFLIQGYWGMFAHLAVFVTDVDSTETFGLSYGISDCDAECYNPVTREKVWGTITATLLWDNIKIIFTKRLDKYRYKVMSSTGKTILESSSPITGAAFEGISSKDISVYNLRWELIVEPVESLKPSWHDPAIAVTVILTGFLALLVQSVMLQKLEKRLLLLDILPKYALKALQQGQDARRQFDDTAMLFTDIVNFTELSARIPPSELAKFLDELYTMFDRIAEKHDVYKIETIGDAFVCCTGCPYPTTPESDAASIALMAIDLLDAVEDFTSSSGIKIQIRIGLHCGPVIGTIMGTKW